MQFDYPHGLGIDEAKERLEILGEYLFNRHGINVQWKDECATFSGRYLMIHIKGELTVEPERVHFVGDDPGMLWRRKATKYLKEKLEIYLDPRTPPAELPRNK